MNGEKYFCMNTALMNSLFPVGSVGASQVRRYEGGDKGRRTNSFPMDRMSPNKDIAMDADMLRERSRYLYKNTVPAKKAINGIANGVVGTGITPTFKSTDNKAVEKLKRIWKLWGENTCADFHGRLDFYGLTKLIVKTYNRDGEVLIVRRRVPLKESITGLQYQVLEMEYLVAYINYQVLPGGGWTYNGIEYDKRGKTVAYWLFSRHPSEWYTQPVRVLADDVIHVLEVDFPAQNRGVPEAAPTIIAQRDLDEYQDAELMGKKVQAAHAVFRVTNDPEGVNGDPDPNDYDSDADLERVEPGMIYHLFPGEDVKFNTPPTSKGAEEYRRSRLREISAGYEVTYEMMANDYSNVNFSSGRMGWIEHSRTIEDKQWMTVVPQWCKRAMLWFMEQVVVMPGGLVELPADLDVTWTMPRREMIDPVKESEADKNQIRTGVKPWSEAIRERGDNPDDVIEQYKKDLKMWQDAGLKAEWSVDLDPQVTTPAQLKGEK